MPILIPCDIFCHLGVRTSRMCECVQAWGHWSIMNEDYQNSRVRLMRVQQPFPHLTCAVILGYLLNLLEHQLLTIF